MATVIGGVDVPNTRTHARTADPLAKSTASAANAAIGQMKTWIFGTDPGDWVSMAVLSEGNYDIESGLVYSFPVTVIDGEVNIVRGLDINDFSRQRMRLTETELKEERDAVKHLLK